MAGGGAPSAEQTNHVYAAIAPVAARAGLEIAQSLSDADYLVTVTITPDAIDPKKARFIVTSVEPKRATPGSAGDVTAARERITELERWGDSRSAPIYP
jgi:hypothetical protein